LKKKSFGLNTGNSVTYPMAKGLQSASQKCVSKGRHPLVRGITGE